MNRLKLITRLLFILIVTLLILPTNSAYAEDAIMTSVKLFLVDDGWSPQVMESDENILMMGFNGENGEWTCYAKVMEENNQFIFYSVLPNKAPEAIREKVAKFVLLANWGMTLGNFELDLGDGEIRFKTSIDVEGGTLTDTMIKNMVYINVMTMDKYLQGVNKVLYTEGDPQEVIKEIEG
jgi:hypothetical protein